MEKKLDIGRGCSKNPIFSVTSFMANPTPLLKIFLVFSSFKIYQGKIPCFKERQDRIWIIEVDFREPLGNLYRKILKFLSSFEKVEIFFVWIFWWKISWLFDWIFADFLSLSWSFFKDQVSCLEFSIVFESQVLTGIFMIFFKNPQIFFLKL